MPVRAFVPVVLLLLLASCHKKEERQQVVIAGEPPPAENQLTIDDQLASTFHTAGAAYPPRQFTVIALKQERLVEIWTENSVGHQVQVDTYPFTGFSGSEGPKLKSGDRQIPEGVYNVEYLNPNSRYHLSMKISYPNDFDRIMAGFEGRKELGGDIFIHGKSSSVGCIPIGDINMEKLYSLAEAVGKENITVIVSPYDMRQQTKELAVGAVSWLPLKYARIRKELVKYTTTGQR